MVALANADLPLHELGVELYDRYAAEPTDNDAKPQPAARIAAELEAATGVEWSRDKAWKRFGPESAARKRIAARKQREQDAQIAAALRGGEPR